MLLQADAQLSVDEAEYEARLAARLQEARAREPNHVDDAAGRDAALAQEVGASWVRCRRCRQACFFNHIHANHSVFGASPLCEVSKGGATPP